MWGAWQARGRAKEDVLENVGLIGSKNMGRL